MKKLKIILGIIGISQLVLGALSLFVPQFFLQTAMGLSATSPDVGYPIGMLASRFIVMGISMFVTISNPQKYRDLINIMILIQIIDFVVGVGYVLSGVVSIDNAIIPLFNASLFATLLFLWRPTKP